MTENTHIHYDYTSENRGIVTNQYGVLVRGLHLAHGALDELMNKIEDHPMEEGEELSIELRLEATIKTYIIEYDEYVEKPEKPTLTKWQRIWGILSE